MSHDAFVFGNQFPAYRDDPIAETLQAISVLQSSEDYANRYEDFQSEMVYGDLIPYAACLATLQELAELL